MAKRDTPPEACLDKDGKPICLWCKARLRKAARSSFWNYSLANVQPYGWLGNGMFCSERCAANWGITKASRGEDA